MQQRFGKLQLLTSQNHFIMFSARILTWNLLFLVPFLVTKDNVIKQGIF